MVKVMRHGDKYLIKISEQSVVNSWIISQKELNDLVVLCNRFKDGHNKSSNLFPTLRLKELEKRAIIRALKIAGGNQTDAAKLLGITQRAIHHKIHSVHKIVDLYKWRKNADYFSIEGTKMNYKMIVRRMSFEKTRVLLFGDEPGFYVIALFSQINGLKIGDEIEYEPKAINFGMLVKKQPEEPKILIECESDKSPDDSDVETRRSNALSRKNTASAIEKTEKRRKRLLESGVTW